ncbi:MULTISPECIES: phage minor head protein [unclassified Thioalkalivibrio]|uniref:phage minor head protein n=1 Tax=unclassified Thioalkalivibrio TaxID=2621013 RepID=UPI000368E682|nr:MULTISPECIES: phage minor head protein [unclassified Thioalkalivibrio]
MSAHDYRETPGSLSLGASFNLPPKEAVEFFRAKGLKTTFDWRDMLGAEHDHAFTVAKMMDVDMLGDVRKALDEAMARGGTLRQFRDDLIPTLQARGWWGRKDVVDPLTGERVNALLGSSGRLQTIFRTNLQSAYSVGAWERIEEQAEEAPYLMYDAVDDHRTRPEHEALNGTVLPVTDQFWQTHYPPNGWNCRCGVQQLSETEMAARGLKPSRRPSPGTKEWKNPRTGETHRVPRDLDPGWDHNPGLARSQKAQALLQEKIQALPPDMRPAPGKTFDGRGYAGAQPAGAVTREQKARRLESTKNAEHRAAQKQLDDIAGGNVPDPGKWKAKALAQLKKNDGWNASPAPEKLGALLARAKALQKKNTNQGYLSGYKKNILAGKSPTPAQRKALDSLPGNERKAWLEKLGTAKANAEAKKYLDGLSSPTAPIMEKAALKKLTNNGTAAGMTAKELADQVKAQAAALQAKSQAKAAVAGYKKKAIKGETPTPKQSAAFKALSKKEQAAVLQEIDAGKAQAAQAAAAAKAAKKDSDGPTADLDAGPPLNTADMDQIGGQGGSNPGGMYRDRQGDRWYVKNPPDPDQARNEVLAARLYALAGVDVPDVRMATRDGRTAVASKVLDGVERNPNALRGTNKPAGARDGFAVDAWLANWDVVGLEYDNMMVRAGKAIRIDTGGALLYRAQGQRKGDAFGDSVTEWISLRDPSTNSQAASVFGGMDQAALQASARRVLEVSDADIRSTVMAYGPGDTAARTALANRLIARKRDIAKRADLDIPGGPKPASSAQAAASIKKAQSDAQGSVAVADQRVIDAAKGISMQAAQGGTLRAKDILRARQALDAIDETLGAGTAYVTRETKDALRAHYKAVRRQLEDIIDAGEGAPAAWGAGIHKAIAADRIQVDNARVPPDLAPRPGDYDTAAVQKWAASIGYGANRLQPHQRDAMRKHNVPEVEMQALAAYTGAAYRTMNEALRQQRPMTEPIRQAVAAATEALRKLPQRPAGEYTRGVNSKQVPNHQAYVRAHTTPGTRIEWQSFSSSSYGGGFGGDMRFTVRTRQPHADVDGVSSNMGEREVLLPPGTIVEVKSAEQRGAVWHVVVEEVLDGGATQQFTEGETMEQDDNRDEDTREEEERRKARETMLERSSDQAGAFRVIYSPKDDETKGEDSE